MEQENLNPEQTPGTGTVMKMPLPETGQNPEASQPADAAETAGPAVAGPAAQAEAFIRSLGPSLEADEFEPDPGSRQRETAVRQSTENPNDEEVQRVKYAPLQPGAVEAPLHNIDYLKDINLEAGVELGNTSMSVEQILSLGVGSIIELNQTVGEPVRLLINSHVYAQGEVVVIGDKFGIRISKIAQA